MDILNITEFKDYITEKRPKEIIYNDENNSIYIQGQKHRCYSPSQTLRMCLTFDCVFIDTSPLSRLVRLKNKTGAMTFSNVRKICIDNDCIIGDIVNLYCGDKKSSVYTLVIR